MKKRKVTWRFALIIFVVFVMFISKGIKEHRNDLMREKLYLYLLEEENQSEVFNTAVALNGGKTANTCVYFVSEALRRNNIMIPEYTCNTSQLISELRSIGWTKKGDYEKLGPGDIVFTTDTAGNSDGVPTHTYIFMEWVEEGSYDYAYICDNQANEYGSTYHIRNIKKPDEVDGSTKEAFSFFMRP